MSTQLTHPSRWLLFKWENDLFPKRVDFQPTNFVVGAIKLNQPEGIDLTRQYEADDNAFDVRWFSS